MNSVKMAACIVLLRNKGKEQQVYLVKRSEQLAFLGGFHAFPGGTFDAADELVEIRDALPHAIHSSALYSTALRELFEETGVLHPSPIAAVERHRLRQAVLHNSNAWHSYITEHHGSIDASRLVPIGRWRTPPFVTTTYDAQYFALTIPADESPDIWPGELTHGAWYTPEQALRAHERGELFLSYPVLETLKAFVTFDNDLQQIGQSMVERGKELFSHEGGDMIYGVRMLPLRTPTLPPATHTNCYVLGDGDLVVIDPATPHADEQERLLAYLNYLESKGHRIREIWLTHHHPDHVGAVAFLQRKKQLPVAAHAFTARELEGQFPIERFIADNEVLELATPHGPPLQWQALHTPGHAIGHLCFYEKRTRAMLSGDNVLGVGSVLVAPPQGNMQHYLNSLERLLQFDIGLMFPAHGPPIAAAHRRVREYIDHRLKREESILHALSSPADLRQIVERVYTDVSPALWPMAELSVQAHLEKLIAEQQVGVDNNIYSAQK